MSCKLVAEISVNKLIKNAKTVFGLLDKGVLRCAVVKSNAYGHGIAHVASILYPYCDYFAVSLLSEVEKLRISGIDKPILVLTPPFKETVDKLVKLNAVITISKFSDIKLVEESAKKQSKRVGCHIAINTGMNRLGFSSLNAIVKAVNLIKNSEYLELQGAYSHFANPVDKDFTEIQFEKFLILSKPIKERNKNAILHVSASSGLLLDKKYQLNMVRVGILLYGYLPINASKVKVMPIMKIKARAIMSRGKVDNEHLLYGDYLSADKRVSLLRLGYADGFLRCGFENSVNNLCMDICAVKGVKKGLVTVMDDASKLARKLKTIPYEVLVNVTKRAQIIYKD